MAKRTYKLEKIKSNEAFEELYDDCEELKTLPLTHKKNWRIAEKMLNNGTIPLESCDVFLGENVQYFFYGRPAYVVAQDTGNRRDHLYFPVCFLVDPTYVEITNIFPFDTGAFAEGFYDDYIDKTMDINGFQIAPTIQSIKGFVKGFYGDNKKYYTRNPKNIAISYDTNDELYAYINIMTASGAPPFDGRAESIEIITKKPFSIHQGVKALVIPNEFEFASETRDAVEELKSSGVDIITYQIMGLGAEQYNAIMYDKVYEYFLSKGYFTSI